ncbi:MAG: hypothetical protein JWL83_1299 [Actinomycetia bacterium]|jgi:hypothetical protein|nr:hypothetical protein [Actinomycetes bacterium]
MIRQVVQRVIHETGNGRALENTRREAYRDRFVSERIEALAHRLPAPAARLRQAGGRGAA